MKRSMLCAVGRSARLGKATLAGMHASVQASVSAYKQMSARVDVDTVGFDLPMPAKSPNNS